MKHLWTLLGLTLAALPAHADDLSVLNEMTSSINQQTQNWDAAAQAQAPSSEQAEEAATQLTKEEQQRALQDSIIPETQEALANDPSLFTDVVTNARNQLQQAGDVPDVSNPGLTYNAAQDAAPASAYRQCLAQRADAGDPEGMRDCVAQRAGATRTIDPNAQPAKWIGYEQ